MQIDTTKDEFNALPADLREALEKAKSLPEAERMRTLGNILSKETGSRASQLRNLLLHPQPQQRGASPKNKAHRVMHTK